MCKYNFRPAKFMVPTLVGYWVTLYLITDGDHTYTMFNQDEWLENRLLMSESTYVQGFTKEILVTPTDFSHIFSEIQNYVNNVSQSNFN